MGVCVYYNLSPSVWRALVKQPSLVEKQLCGLHEIK